MEDTPATPEPSRAARRPRIDACDHDWIAHGYQGKPDAVRCSQCEATPVEVIAVTGEVKMPCEPGHVLTDPNANFGAHIHSALIGDGTLWSCETEMPGWADE